MIFSASCISDTQKLFSRKFGGNLSLEAVATIGFRLSNLLWYNDFAKSNRKSLCIEFANKFPVGISHVAKLDKNLDMVTYNLPSELVVNSYDPEELFIKIFSEVVLQTLNPEAPDLAILKRQTDFLLAERSRAYVVVLKRVIQDLMLEVQVSFLEPFSYFCQVYIQAVDTKRQLQGKALVAELHYFELCYFVRDLKIKDNDVWIQPKKSQYLNEYQNRYLARGFTLPLKISLDDLFLSDS